MSMQSHGMNWDLQHHCGVDIKSEITLCTTKLTTQERYERIVRTEEQKNKSKDEKSC